MFFSISVEVIYTEMWKTGNACIFLFQYRASKGRVSVKGEFRHFKLLLILLATEMKV